MTSRLLLFCFIAGTIFSCNKPLPDYSHIPFAYSVSGLHDTTLPANDYSQIYASITLVSGNPENQPITVNISGLPGNVLTERNNFSFRPNYVFMDSVAARNAVQGTYPIQVVFTSPNTATQTYTFNLTVTPPVGRVAPLMGYYYPSNSCANNIYVSCQIDSIPGSPGRFWIIDRVATNPSTYGTFDTAYGIVDSFTNTFVVPSQRVQGVTVSGSGSFNGSQGQKTVYLYRTFITDTLTYTCDVILTN